MNEITTLDLYDVPDPTGIHAGLAQHHDGPDLPSGRELHIAHVGEALVQELTHR